jgi:hypothetical protein
MSKLAPKSFIAANFDTGRQANKKAGTLENHNPLI